MRFAELLDAVDELPIADQAELVEIVRRRLVEHRRAELAEEIQDARRDFQAGRCHPAAPDEILRDILS
jgi:predicted AAA+ superfamily ATPase